MGRLVKRIFQILFIVFINIQFTDCDREVADETWIIEWTFIDTINQIDQINYKIDMMTDIPRYNRHGNGLLDSTGILHEAFNSVEKEDFLVTNPIFYIKLFKIDSTIVYDSSFTLEQMDFKEQFSVIDNEIRENVSKRTVYITTSAKSGIEQH